MRPMIVISALVALVCRANPILWGDATYMASEHAVVTLSTNEARFEGSFVFRGLKAADTNTIRLKVTIWYPEPELRRDLRTLFGEQVSSDKPLLKGEDAERFASLLDLKVRGGTEQLPVKFAFFEKIADGTDPWPTVRANRTGIPGFETTAFIFWMPVTTITNDQPILISYRHPLRASALGGHFHYLPMFNEHPSLKSTANTNDYAISVRIAEGSSASITNGADIFRMDQSQTLILSPSHHQPIDVQVVPLNDPLTK